LHTPAPAIAAPAIALALIQVYLSRDVVAWVTPSQQKEEGVHSGVCASAKVKRWHDEATFLPCKHNMAPLQLSQAACVCVCVRVCACVCVSHEASSRCALADEGAVKGKQCTRARTCKHTPIFSVLHVQHRRQVPQTSKLALTHGLNKP